ncbi:tripartite motif-containing protein 43C-like [Acomys russatus]|uniref:tripartite motif-containing protein 43C-like n=1 Tax=Acomys russatus TaxID=60746 RepID=UPI0021E2F5D8|nr:tripartite motif-containing protein 43C-like [Acomys russatus]
MASLWEKTQENQENLEAEKRMTSRWMDYVTLQKEMIRTKYRKVHPHLYEEERQHLECVNHEGQTVLEELRKSEAMMVQKRNQLIEMYQELMRMSQQPYVLLLQDLDAMFRRSESVQLCLPQRIKPELKALPITGLTERSNCFRVNIFFKYVITLHYKKYLSEIISGFGFRPRHQETAAESAQYYYVSWAAQSFTSGKYYWEIDLTESREWTLGVCTDDWLKNRNQQIESKSAFLLMCMKVDNHYRLLTTCPGLRHYVEKPVSRVGVLLDCEGGCVSFLNVAKSSLIYSYPPGTFRYRVRPFLCISHT